MLHKRLELAKTKPEYLSIEAEIQKEENVSFEVSKNLGLGELFDGKKNNRKRHVGMITIFPPSLSRGHIK